MREREGWIVKAHVGSPTGNRESPGDGGEEGMCVSQEAEQLWDTELHSKTEHTEVVQKEQGENRA